MWDNQPNLYYEKTEDTPTVEFESWWEIDYKQEDIRHEMKGTYEWEGKKFPTRIEALKYQRNNPEHFRNWVHVVIICKSKEKK